MTKKTVCSKCKKNPIHRNYRCKECQREYSRLDARKRYARDFKADPPEYRAKKVIDHRLKIAGDIRTPKRIRQSLSRKFGARPEQKYDANSRLQFNGVHE